VRIIASVQAKRGSSRGLVHYIAHSKLDIEREPEKGRELFNAFADNLSVESANNSLKVGIGSARPSNEELHHLVLSFRPDDHRALGRDDKARRSAIKEVTRAAMSRLETHLAADRLFWVASVHLNTGNPHVHIALQKQYFTREIERGFLAKIPRDALPHYELSGGEKVLMPGLLIESAIEKTEQLINRDRGKFQDHDKDEVGRRSLPSSPENADRDEVRQDTTYDREILRQGFLAEHELHKIDSKIDELTEHGNKMRFLVSDPESGRRRRMSLHDIGQREELRRNASTSPAEAQIRAILFKMLAKEAAAKVTHQNDSAPVVREANRLKGRYRRNDWKLPPPAFTKDDLDNLQDHYIQTTDLRKFSYLESVRSELERSGDIEPRDKVALGRIAAKKSIADLRQKVHERSYLDFRDGRYYRRVEIDAKYVSLSQLDREETVNRNADLSLLGQLRKAVSPVFGKKARDAVEIENDPIRDSVINNLDERLAAIKSDQKSEHKKAKVFEKILTAETEASFIMPVYSPEELAEIDALSSRLKLRPVYEQNCDRQRALIEAAGNDCKAYQKLLKADPSADFNEHKRGIIGGRAIARQIVAKVEFDKANDDLKNFTGSRRFQKFPIPDDKTGKATFLSLHDVDLPRRVSILDRALDELFEGREHRRLRRTVTSLAMARERRLKDDLDAAKDILASTSSLASEFSGFSFLGLTSEPIHRPIFTFAEITAIETRASNTADKKEAARLEKIVESTANDPQRSLKEILADFENLSMTQANERERNVVSPKPADRFDDVAAPQHEQTAGNEGKIKQPKISSHSR
jgi:hypothetical protein